MIMAIQFNEETLGKRMGDLSNEELIELLGDCAYEEECDLEAGDTDSADKFGRMYTMIEHYLRNHRGIDVCE